MRFTTPLALLCLLAIPYFIWLGQPRQPRRRWREWLSTGLRSFILLLLVFSLAGAQMVQAADALAVVFLVDASDSISPEQAAQAEMIVRSAIETMTVNDEAAVILFGANALVERPMSGLAELAPVTSVPQQLHTDLAEAIRLGLAIFPSGRARRIVVLSDGAVTIGDTEGAAKLSAAAGVAIDTIYLPRPTTAQEVILTDVQAPTRVQHGETFRIEVTAQSTADMPATLRIIGSSNVVYEDDVSLRVGRNNFVVRLQATEQEFARYRVQLTPQNDTYYQNNELAAFTEIVGPSRILLVAPDGTTADDGTPLPDEAPALQAALTATGLSVERITPADLPTGLAQLSNYASILLVNVNAKNLSPRKMSTLQSYVRDLGGGLVVVGGPQSYGMGGYYKTALEETLPVDMQIKDQERFPSVSIVIVIDRSGSMGANEGSLTKIQLAAEGAVRVVELLNDFDEITVIPVDTQPDNPIGPISASQREEAIARIRQIGAGGGGIYVRTGLEAAVTALAGSDNQVKHIIILADGADSEEKEGVPELIETLTADGVTISTVSIGEGADTAWLQAMAELGNGRFHFTNQAANLPQIFTQETTSIQRSYLVEEAFFPTLANSSPILSGIRQVPTLYGYVGTSPKGTAQVILRTHLDDPLLAAWQYGLGRSVAWTSDASGRWANDWVRWEGFPRFWAQTVRWTISENRDSAVETAVTFEDEMARLTVDARDTGGEFLNDLTMDVNVVAPDGEVSSLTLPQIAPGRYETTFAPTVEGAYFLRVAGAGEDETVIGQTSGWVLGYSPEYVQFESDPTLLASVRELTGGRALLPETATTAVFVHDLPSEATSRPIWPWLTLLAVLLLPVDIAMRRLVLTKRDWQKVWAVTLGRWQRQPVAAPTQSEPMARLFQAKQRANRPDTTATSVFAGQERGGGDGGEDGVEDGVEKRPLVTDKPTAKPISSTQPSSRPSTVPSSSARGTLASRLLDKKRQQDADSD